MKYISTFKRTNQLHPEKFKRSKNNSKN